VTNAVFTHSPSSRYDDLPEQRYHFPRTYLNQVREAKGEWIVYYEPRRTSGRGGAHGRQAYFAVAFVQGVQPDPRRPDHFYASLSGYFELESPVPFREGRRYYEAGLRKPDGSTNRGAFGRAVRLIDSSEFEAIVSAGTAVTLDALLADALDEAGQVPDIAERPILERISRRALRDAAFRGLVRRTYRNTCAFTGLALVNGGGRPEVQAAHIRPVASMGPDSVRNGLALTATAHWLFDRGLVSVSDDYRLLLAPRGVPGELRRMFRQGLEVWVPDDTRLRPHPAYLAWHREHVFKG